MEVLNFNSQKKKSCIYTHQHLLHSKYILVREENQNTFEDPLTHETKLSHVGTSLLIAKQAYGDHTQPALDWIVYFQI